jgi:hypothetical protein
MGRLIPAGTGIPRYRNIRLVAEAVVEVEAEVDAPLDDELLASPEEVQEESGADVA